MVIDSYKPRFISKVKRGRNWIPKAVRSEVYDRDQCICQYCHKKVIPSKLTIEHVIPVSKGGIDDIINYITVCRSCNSSKKDKSLVEFIKNRWDIQISDLPIHGDIIMDTPELDEEYRRMRHVTYYNMRKKGLLKGSDALKKLEKMFRYGLWQTPYGTILAKRYPELPGQVRASVPLVEYLVPDTRKPVHRMLIELCKSGPTRALIDDMIRLVSNSTLSNADSIIRSVIHGSYDDATNKRIDQAFTRAKIKRRDNSIFEVPTELEKVPVQERDIIEVKITDIEDGIGISEVDNFKIMVPETIKGQKYEVLIRKVYSDHADGNIARLPQSD